MVLDLLRVKDDDVAEIAGFEQPAFLDLERIGRERSEPANRLLQRQDFLVTHVLPQEARKVAIGPRVNARLEKNAFGR